MKTFLCLLLLAASAPLSVCGKDESSYGFEKTKRIQLATMYDLNKKEQIVKWHSLPDTIENPAVNELRRNRYRSKKAHLAFAGFCYAILLDGRGNPICALYIPYLTSSKETVAIARKITKKRGKYIVGESFGKMITFNGLRSIRQYAINLDRRRVWQGGRKR